MKNKQDKFDSIDEFFIEQFLPVEELKSGSSWVLTPSKQNSKSKNKKDLLLLNNSKKQTWGGLV